MSEQRRKVVPAQLGFLAIYNPSLGTADEDIDNQIVYYYPSSKQIGNKRSASTDAIRVAAKEHKNEQLRQIGLAQGMVEFGRSFSDGKSVDTVETEKSRIILHELESGWWILASISLTVLPGVSKTPASKRKAAEEHETIEYSSREVKPAILLLGDLLRAHSTFLLHHASSMSALFVRTKRSKFISILGRFWDTWLFTWSVLMHGNPANDLYGGIKVAACGELGVGVGEEERGSGEREVLEGMVGQTDGLIDMMVSRFGDAQSNQKDDTNKSFAEQRSRQSGPWLGSGNEPSAEDGAIFLGTGALSRKSLRDVSHWVEDLYRWGPYTYGILDNPSSTRRAKKSKPRPIATRDLLGRNEPSPNDSKKLFQPGSSLSNDISLYDDVSRTSSIATSEAARHEDDNLSSSLKSQPPRPAFRRNPASHTSTDSDTSKSKKFSEYFKFGYGTHWSLGSSLPKNGESSVPVAESNTSNVLGGAADIARKSSPIPEFDDSMPHYLVGLMGGLEDGIQSPADVVADDEDAEDYNTRLLLRTVTVELEREEDARQENEISIDYSDLGRHSSSRLAGSEHTNASNASYESQDRNKTKKLRIVIYVSRPFIYVLFFELRADALALPGFYRGLHKQLSPLHKPLINSTSFRASKPVISPSSPPSVEAPPVYDLLYDPVLLTLYSTIPSIPDPNHLSESLPWTRIEALNTHMQIVNTYIATTTDPNTLERTCKTSRGYWVLWTRIPSPPVPHRSPSPSSGHVKIPTLIPEDSAETKDSKTFLEPSPGPSSSSTPAPEQSNATSTVQKSMRSGPAHPFLDGAAAENEVLPKDKEIFLVRRASDYAGSKGMVGRLSGSGNADEGWSAAGLGLDTKRYIEGLLSLNR